MVSRLNSSVHYIIGSAQASQTKFDFNFPVLNGDDIKVVLGEGQEMSVYTVTINAQKNGGHVDFPNAFLVGTHVTIYREMVYSRQTQFRENEDFHASVINEEFDRMVMLLQQAGKASKDSLRQAKYDVPMDMTLPSALSRADKILGFDSSGRPHVLFDPSESAKNAKKSEILSQKNADITDRNLKVIENNIKISNSDIFAQIDASNIDSSAYKTKLSLGDAAYKNVGINPDEIPALDTNGKLPSSVYKAGALPTKLFMMKNGTFFIRNADGSLPIGILSSKVWSLSEQKLSFGGLVPSDKTCIELPVGIVLFTVAGAGGGGACGYGSGGFASGGNGGLSELVSILTANGGFGGKSAFQRVNSWDHTGNGRGGSGGLGGIHSNGSYSYSGRDGADGDLKYIYLELVVGQVIDFNVGAGGGSGTTTDSIPSNGGKGANGYIEVEYV